jgi:hypothetical protein
MLGVHSTEVRSEDEKKGGQQDGNKEDGGEDKGDLLTPLGSRNAMPVCFHMQRWSFW